MGADEYRRHAAQCWAVAELAENETIRRALTEMAAKWERLADHAEKAGADAGGASPAVAPHLRTPGTDA